MDIDIEPMDIDIDNIDKIKQRLSKELIGVSEVTNTPIRETITSQEFRNRLNTGKDGKPGYDPNNKCVKEYGKLYEYSELKSSLLINEVINKNKQQLSEFINKISKNYCSTIETDFNLEVSNYSKLLPTSIQIDASKETPYPVVDMSKFYNKPELIKSDFYASYNFMKYIWVSTFDKDLVNNIRKVKPEKLENAITLENFIHLVQQPIFGFGETAKRNTRLNLPTPTQRLSNSLGISNITHPDLVQNHYWLHPGRTRCRIPYATTYGNKLYDAYISEDILNFHSSVQCGISGSVNFGIFMYILSIANEGGPKGQELVEDISYLIFSVSAILVADGGHNIRETITGVTLTSIALKSYKDKVENELARLPGEDLESKLTYIKNNFNNDYLSLYDSLIYKNMDILAWFLIRCLMRSYQDTEPINIFINWLRAMKNWSSFIDELHKQLRQIDPMGIDLNTKMYTDLTLNDMLKEIGGGVRNAEREEEFYMYLQNIIFNDWYNREGDVRETDGIDGKKGNIYLERRKLAVNATVLYTAFDKVIDSDGVLRRRFESIDRYTFWDGPTQIMNNIIPLKTLVEVNTKMQEVLDNCHGAKQFNPTLIPYAGGKSTKTRRRKSTRSQGRKSTRSQGRKSTRSQGRKSTKPRGRKSTRSRGRKSHPLSK